MENYKIISDEQKFREFIEWLPPLEKHERIYVALFARGKYDPRFESSKSDAQQLARFVTTKDKIYDRVKQLECEVGSYNKNGHAVPQDVLALYVNPSPRCMKRASVKLAHELLRLVSGEHDNYNLTQLALTASHRAKGKNQVVAFDYDLPSENLDELVKAQVELVKEVVNPEALTLTRTRGGIHVFVKPELVHKEFTKSWYKDLLALPHADKDRAGDFETPAWGTFQGSFTPYRIEL